MAVDYAAAIKTDRLQVVADALDGGSLVIGTSALSGATGVLATVPLDSPAATVAGDELELDGLPLSATAAATGTAAKAELRDSGGAVVASGLTVGTVGTNIVLNSVDVESGADVEITAATITHG